jgi:hypothetical protein
MAATSIVDRVLGHGDGAVGVGVAVVKATPRRKNMALRPPGVRYRTGRLPADPEGYNIS